MSTYVFSFGGGTADGDGTMKDTLGGKGAGLAEMSRAGVPVPPGFTISTDVCNLFFDNKKKVPKEVDKQMLACLAKLEKEMGRKLGDEKDPLLVSVRSGAKFSMPGMMDTVLNLGLNDKSVKGLIAKSGDERFSYDCYRRFIQMFGNVVMDIEKEEFEHVFDSQKKKSKAKFDTDLTAADLKKVIADYKKVYKKATGQAFPQNPIKQLEMSRDAVFGSWWNARASHYRKMNKIADNLGTAVNVQTMVYGNMGDTSATGVGFTRNPATGNKEFYGEYLVNAQGEDVVAGIRTPQPIITLCDIMPEAFDQLKKITTSLEQHYKDVQDFEFTIQDKKLYMLQTRNGKRTGPAAVKIASDMVHEGLITKEEAVMRVDPQQLDQLLHPVIDPKTKSSLKLIGKGLPASPGAAVGKIVFSADDAVEEAPNSPVILVRQETVPDDIHGMEVAKGILTSRGGMTSHAAVVARGMGIPCVAGAESIKVDVRAKKLAVAGVTLKEGDWLSLDGSIGEVYAGQAATVEPDPTSGMLAEFMGWADEFRGDFGVRANADVPRDAKVARKFGAEGIGLCRTEHMFFGEGKIEHVQAMILSDSEKDRKKALKKLLPMQRRDFAGLFKAMDGFPVVIRTLDPPLHEFVPKREEIMVDLAKLPHAKIAEKREMSARYDIEVKALKKELPALLARVESLHEFNPMLGHRGCRLGISFPEITEMQARAISQAAIQVAKKGVKVIPEVMIPLIGGVEELAHQKAIVKAVFEEEIAKAGIKLEYMIGTMIEIPRAALTADKVATEAEFFSFGTNDLTQTGMGLSRDDYVRFAGDYEDQKIFKNDPFQVLDQEGIGQLVDIGVTKGRETNPDLEVGICGEHGGEPESVGFCYRVGMNYVSCSPYRVPIARLAAAQSAIIAKSKDAGAETMRTA